MKKLVIAGALHPIKVSLVTRKHLSKIVTKSSRDVLLGIYLSDDNVIYVDKSQETNAKMHTFWHEFYHAFLFQTFTMDEEAKCDAFATLIERLFAPTSLEEFLAERNK